MSHTPEPTAGTLIRTTLSELRTAAFTAARTMPEASCPEPLHDLRVAARRARTVVGQLPSLFPQDATAAFQSGLKSIGRTTGPCRDLDVWHQLLTDTHGRGAPTVLASTVAALARRARKTVVRSLEERWFSELEIAWTDIVDPDHPLWASPTAGRTVASVTGPRIGRANRRFTDHARALDPDGPLSAYHRVRIDAKKLRYLMEFFGPAVLGDTAPALVDGLKSVQDILGTINDRMTQLRALDALAATVFDHPAAAPAVEAHRSSLHEDLERGRRAFPDRLEAWTRLAEQSPIPDPARP